MSETIVIIGSGAAGGVLAARLSQSPNRNVILLEKGRGFSPDQIPPELRFAFMASTVDHPECPVSEHGDLLDRAVSAMTLYPAQGGSTMVATPRGEVLGGSSQLNAGIWLWGLPEDYDEWAQHGNTGWAFSDVQRSFAAVECDRDFTKSPHGVNGPVPVNRVARANWVTASRAFVESCRLLGHVETEDFNGTGAEGVGALPFNIERGVRYGTAIAYLTEEVRKRRNLTIHTETSAERLVIENGRIVAVEANCRGTKLPYYADRFILSAGSIGSPQLLLRSGIGAREHLSACRIETVHQLEGVGELQDHPCILLYWTLKPSCIQERDATGYQVSLRFTVPGSRFRNDAQINCLQFGFGAAPDGSLAIDRCNIGMACHLNRAESRGQLRLDPEASSPLPLLDYRYLSDPDDLQRMRNVVRHAFEIAAAQPFRSLIQDPHKLDSRSPDLSESDLHSDNSLDSWLKKHVETGQHTSSTCRMGPATDPRSVVDERGFVHGLENIQIIDSSIIPICPRANTCAATMMIAEHLYSRTFSN
jgi:choline dehydrogenase-like flavoprotein